MATDYTATTLAGLADAAKGARPLVIADQSKAGDSLSAIEAEAARRGLIAHAVSGRGEEGQTTKYVVIGRADKHVEQACNLIRKADHRRVNGKARARFQRTMGELLGYDKESIESFVVSDIARDCRCACCGG